MQQLCNMLKKI